MSRAGFDRSEVASVARVLDALDTAYGGDMAEYLGPEWRIALTPHLRGVWRDGYHAALSEHVLPASTTPPYSVPLGPE